MDVFYKSFPEFLRSDGSSCLSNIIHPTQNLSEKTWDWVLANFVWTFTNIGFEVPFQEQKWFFY